MSSEERRYVGCAPLSFFPQLISEGASDVEGNLAAIGLARARPRLFEVPSSRSPGRGEDHLDGRAADLVPSRAYLAPAAGGQGDSRSSLLPPARPETEIDRRDTQHIRFRQRALLPERSKLRGGGLPYAEVTERDLGGH